MTELLKVEVWAIVVTGAFVAIAAVLIRVGWRRGKKLEDR
jgi:hypothetical protein